MFSFCNSRQRYWVMVTLALAVLPFGGCVVGPNYHLPPAPTPPAYKEVGAWKAAEPSDDKLGGKWWKIFQDPQLNALEEDIDISNQNLKAASAQYQQSGAVLRQYRADYYPTVTANPSAGRTRYSYNRPPHSPTFSGVTFNDFVLPFELDYEADVWGCVRRTVESYRAQARPAPPISPPSISACMRTWPMITSQLAVWMPKKNFCKIPSSNTRMRWI